MAVAIASRSADMAMTRRALVCGETGVVLSSAPSASSLLIGMTRFITRWTTTVGDCRDGRSRQSQRFDAADAPSPSPAIMWPPCSDTDSVAPRVATRSVAGNRESIAGGDDGGDVGT